MKFHYIFILSLFFLLSRNLFSYFCVAFFQGPAYNFYMIRGDLFIRIENLKPSFNKAFLNVADFILSNKEELKYMRIKNLAERCNVSEATITRFIKKIGFSSFHNFKMVVAQVEAINEEEPKESLIIGDIEKKDDLKT